MAITREIKCAVCGEPGTETRSGGERDLPEGWMWFQGQFPNALNLEVQLCDKCAHRAARRWDPLA